jgi:4-phospho-D-threonate 3-dehydrogenase / 4-phospho-D-erythronate 3-dehydrogenase
VTAAADSTDHLAAADNTDSTDHLAAADNTDSTDHLAAADNADNADRRLATGKRDRPRVGITVGDPAGIGPEIARKAAADPRVLEACEPILYGPPDGEPFELGRVSARAGRAAYDAIVSAVEDAMQGRIDAVATAPINKEAFAAAGVPWRGHTELLAHLTGARRVAMMFHADVLRVVLATVHIPLAEVPAALTRDVLEETIALAAGELPRFGLPSPRLAVAGLNPHAGEHGLMGFEEDAVMVPAIDACRAKGIRVEGPLPADTVFVRAMRGDFDAVIACYHDQGLIPVKLVAFGRAVNVTLGLPIIRTSVDHGTAFDIAGQGAADPSSLVHAVLLAAQLASTRA